MAEKAVACSFCGKMIRVENLRLHEQAHNPAPPPDCPHVFRIDGSLWLAPKRLLPRFGPHQRFWCALCGAKLKTWEVPWHSVDAHGDVLEVPLALIAPDSEMGRIKCPDCAVFLDAGELAAHRNAWHSSYRVERAEAPPRQRGVELLRDPVARAGVGGQGEPRINRDRVAVGAEGVGEGPEARPTARPCTCGGSNERCSRCFGTGTITGPATEGYRGAAEGLRKNELGWLLPSPAGRRRVRSRKRARKETLPDSGLVPCPQCHARVRPSKLKGHLKRVHRVAVSGGNDAQGSRSTAPSAGHQSRSEADPTGAERSLDRSKGYAHAFREHGRFGSHPSHDDHGDESKP